MGRLLVVDTSALMAILLEEADALLFAQALHDADELRMSAPSWLEAAQVATCRRGVQGHALFEELVTRLAIEIVPCDEGMAKGLSSLVAFRQGSASCLTQFRRLLFLCFGENSG